MAGGWTTPALVSEVSDAGGLGMLATTGVVIGTYEPAGEIVTGSFALD
jgi:NAD(P)H-dependent flavin oxidoreductase YrpB (nitropropane dioxygenase family)